MGLRVRAATPAGVSEELAAFLLGNVQSFDCANIDANGPFGPIGLFASLQPWLTWLAALLWRQFGVNQTALLPLVAVLAGLYAAGCYALSRLFLGRLLAIVAGVVLSMSPAATEMAIYLRDSSKAPFFIWALVFLMLALRPHRRGLSMVFAALAGAIVGIGYGFRADSAIIAPIGAAVLTIAGLVGLRANPFRILAPVVFLGAAVLLALPALGPTNILGGGSLPMQGASKSFRDYAGIEPAGYALAWAYSDELTLSEIASAQRPKAPDWDAQPGQRYYGVSQAMQRATPYLLGWAPLFAADFATQALKSAGWVLAFPSLFVRSDMPWARIHGGLSASDVRPPGKTLDASGHAGGFLRAFVARLFTVADGSGLHFPAVGVPDGLSRHPVRDAPRLPPGVRVGGFGPVTRVGRPEAGVFDEAGARLRDDDCHNRSGDLRVLCRPDQMAAGSALQRNRQPGGLATRGFADAAIIPPGRQRVPCIAGSSPACRDRCVGSRRADAGDSPGWARMGCARRSRSPGPDGCRRALPGGHVQGSPRLRKDQRCLAAVGCRPDVEHTDLGREHIGILPGILSANPAFLGRPPPDEPWRVHAHP